MDIAKMLSKDFSGTDTFAGGTEVDRIKAITGVDITGMTRAQGLSALGGKLGSSISAGYQVEVNEYARYSEAAGVSVMAKLAKPKISMSDYVGLTDEEKAWAKDVLGIDIGTTSFSRETGLGEWNNATKAGYIAGKARQSELGSLLGGLELDTLKQLLRLAQELADENKKAAEIIPSAATGGFVQKGGLVNIHEGEMIVPKGKGGININIGAGAFVANGVNWQNEGQKRAVAKEMASTILAIVNGNLRTSNSAERKI
jgi:hypothetical protein